MPRKSRSRRKGISRKRRSNNLGWLNTIGSYAKSFGYSGVAPAVTAGMAALKGVRYLKSLINVERKYLDYNQVNQTIGTTPTIYPLSQVGGGDAYNQRDGNSIKAASLLYRMSAVLNPAVEQSFVRAIIFIDHEQRASDPTAAEVLEQSTNYLSAINHLNGTRFTVLRDLYLNLRKDMNASMVTKFLRLGHHIKFSSTTSTDTKEGNIYLLLISDTNVNAPTIDFNSRLRFIDN